MRFSEMGRKKIGLNFGFVCKFKMGGSIQ